jgi:heme oxygenase (mycobilin-producing)
MTAVTIDPDAHPDHQFRIDAFSVPEAACNEFEAAMNRNLAFLQTLPGFLGHAVFEKAGGPSNFNVVTIAAWASREAIDNAGNQVRAYYQSIGFDPPAQIERWGAKAEIANYVSIPARGTREVGEGAQGDVRRA